MAGRASSVFFTTIDWESYSVMMTHVFSTANPMSKGLPRAAGAHGMMIKLTEARENALQVGHPDGKDRIHYEIQSG
jgi:hypothetical protein